MGLPHKESALPLYRKSSSNSEEFEELTLRIYPHYQHESRQRSTAQKVCAAFG